MEQPGTPRLRAFAALSLWLGIVGFGGGFAVAQRIRRTVVEERGWLSDATFIEHFSVASALPGTTATNLLTLLGARFGGLSGATLGAAAFLAPSVILMIAFGAAYSRVRGVHALAAFLDGMSFATVGVVAAVAVDMRRTAVKSRLQFAIAAGAAVVLAMHWMTLLEVVAIAGLLGALILRDRALPPPPQEATLERHSFPPSRSPLSLALLPPLLVSMSVSLSLFFVFARIGAATFGGGFAMIPTIEHEVVTVKGWLGEGAFNDAMVLGQVTPGPVAIAATFIGYRVAGLVGALAATLGMFGPPFLLSIIVARSLEAFRGSAVVQGFLRGISPAVVGIIAAAAVSLWGTTAHSWFAAAEAFATFVLLARLPKLSPLIPLAAAGALCAAVRH